MEAQLRFEKPHLNKPHNVWNCVPGKDETKVDLLSLSVQHYIWKDRVQHDSKNTSYCQAQRRRGDDWGFAMTASGGLFIYFETAVKIKHLFSLKLL